MNEFDAIPIALDPPKMKANWLTRNPQPDAFTITAFLGVILWLAGLAYLGQFHGTQLMSATSKQVFQEHQYWRLWSTLFAHGDFAHLLSNWFLFLPFAYLLTGYFGVFFFPLAGIFIGGLINIVVLKTLPAETVLLGISGVVYWMGASWLTLYALIDKRRSALRRLGVALGIALVIFAPETYKPEISYLSHFLGFIFGVASGFIYFVANKSKFEAAEVYAKPEPIPDFEAESKECEMKELARI